MAIAIPNPMFSCISGRIGSVVFYPRYGKQCIRMHVIPRNPDTKAQRIIRRSFAEAVKSWQSLTIEEKLKFNIKAKNLNMSGYNLYISRYMNDHVSARKKPGAAPDLFIGIIRSKSEQNIFPSVSDPYKEHIGINSCYMCFQYAPG